MKEKTKETLVEAAVVGTIFGIVMVIGLHIFIKHECICYNKYGNVYPTTLFDFKKKPCDEQCNFFGEREGIELTNIKPENVKSKWPGVVNYSLEIE